MICVHSVNLRALIALSAVALISLPTLAANIDLKFRVHSDISVGAPNDASFYGGNGGAVVGQYPCILHKSPSYKTLEHEVGHCRGIVGDYDHVGRIMHFNDVADGTRETEAKCDAYILGN